MAGGAAWLNAMLMLFIMALLGLEWKILQIVGTLKEAGSHPKTGIFSGANSRA